MPPRTVGPYEVLSVIGRGGVGTVYRARHLSSGEEVALKLLGPPPACDPIAARRLAREFEALQGLDHPNVVRVHEAGVHDGYSFLAMELVDGLDLRSYLSPSLDDAPDPAVPRPAGAGSGVRIDGWADEPETASFFGTEDASPAGGPEAIRAFAALMEEPETDPRPRPPRAAADDGDAGSAPEARPLAPATLERLNRPARLARLRAVLLQVCDGLAYVHARGLVHRDLKPSNIMVDDARRARLMDFGLVKLAGEVGGLTHHGRVVGTYRYMSPEQARGLEVDARSDLFSLGVVLFEMLCGRPPFAAERPEDLWREIVSRPPPAALALNPGAPPGLARLAETLLAKSPRERPQRAEDVRAAIERA